MKRILATMAAATMIFGLPSTAIAGGKNSGAKCNGPGNDTCGNTTIIGDTDGDGKVENRCYNKTRSSFIVVNGPQCNSLIFTELVIIDL